MWYPGFCGPSNPSQSVLADAEVTKNLYVEQIQSRFAPAETALYPCPGFSTFLTVPQVGTRALFAMADECYGVVGSKFYELFSTGAYLERGTVSVDANPATISSNGDIGHQIGITSGANWYNYDRTSKAFSQVAAMNGKATQGGMKDGYFLCFDVLTGSVFVSNLDDGTTWTTLTDYFQRAIAPDPWRAMVVGNPYIHMLGEQTSEAWYNAGNSPQPFAPILSSFMQYGTPAPFAAGMAEDALTFLGRDKNGQGTVISTQGYTPTPISNYAVETAIQAYARGGSISNAEILIYQDQGHLFGNFSFPNSNGTWTADINGGALWHQRSYWNAAAMREEAWRPRCHCYAFGRHLTGDRSSGTIAVMDTSLGSEVDGSVIRRTRVGPPIWASSRQRLQVGRFQLQVEPGLGVATGQGSNPVVMLRTSKNGKTWSNERQAAVGPMGRYGTRVYWTRCGDSSKLWMPEVTMTDPIPWRISGAELEGRGFASLKAA